MWVLLAVSAALAWGAWAASSPAGSSPDDDFHLASIWCAGGAAQHAEPGQVCATAHGKQTAGSVSRVLPREVAQAACYRWLRLQPASCVRHIPPGNVAQVANDGLYPGGYYAVMHRVVSGSVTTSVMWIRGLNIALALIVFGLAFAVSEARSRAALALTLGLAFCTPLGLFFIPSTNPTAWSMIGIGSLWLFVLAFMTTPDVRRRWAAAGGALLAWGMAVSARADAPVYAALTVAVAAVIGADATQRISRKLLMPAVLVVLSAITFVTGSGGSVASNGVAPSAADGHSAPEFVLHEIAYNTAHPVHLLFVNIGSLWRYERDVFYTGPLGWVDTQMSNLGTVVSLAVLVLVVLALVAHRGWSRAAYAGLLVAALAVPLMVLQRSHLSVDSGYVQARYLYPLMLAVVGLGAYGVMRRTMLPQPPRWVLPAIWAVMTALAALALHIQIRRYVSGLAVSNLDLGVHRGWWWIGSPVSPMGLWLIGSVAMGATIALLLRLATVPQIPEAHATEEGVPGAAPVV